MVEYLEDNNTQQLILAPNRSMSWQENKKILIAMFCVNMAIAITWSAMGAWMVLPFAGLEIFFVGLGMYYVSWKLSFKQIIHIESGILTLQKGVYFPKQEWRWQYSDITLIKKPSTYRMSAPTLFFKHLNERVEIGDFLNRKEKKILRQHLLNIGMPMQVIEVQ